MEGCIARIDQLEKDIKLLDRAFVFVDTTK